jgi:hypothetical protein
MVQLIIVAALVLVGLLAGFFVMIVVSIHVEDRRGSVTGTPPSHFSAGTRGVLGLYADHTACAYVSNPEYACPRCRRSFRSAQNR